MPQVTVVFSPTHEGSRADAVYSNTVADPAGTAVSIMVGSAVPLRRQTEIMSAINFLQSGWRDRNLLDGSFAGVACVATVNINAITANNRRTSSTLAGNTAATTDVSIGIGVTANNGYTTMVETAFEVLKKVLLENIKNGSATASVVMPGLLMPAPNVYTVVGSWPAGTAVQVTTEVTDSAGDVDSHTMTYTLPSDMTAAQAATYLGGLADGEAFIDASVSGTTITLSPTEPGTTLVSSAAVV